MPEPLAYDLERIQFANAPPLCFSIETRKEIGESYSAISGFFRQFELFSSPAMSAT